MFTREGVGSGAGPYRHLRSRRIIGSAVSRGRWLTRGALACSCFTAACGPAGDAPPGGASEDLFVEVARVELAESPDDPIVSIDRVGERPGGGYVVADRHAGKVRLFDPEGRETAVHGRPGSGPGELDEPAGAVELADGRLIVVQRADPRLTIFRPGAEPIIQSIPGQYGFWAAGVEDGFVAGVATRETRFTRFDAGGTPIASFGARDPAVAETPFWIFFATDHAAVLGDRIAVSTSLFPTIRLFTTAGDSIGIIGEPPPSWISATAPPVEDLAEPGSRERLEAWARSFTVIRGLEAASDSFLVVEYGRHDPRETDPYLTVPTTIDVYGADGTKVVEGAMLPGRIVGGGSRLLVLVAEPPSAWTLSVLELRAPE